MGFNLSSTTVSIKATTKPLDDSLNKVKGDLKHLSESTTEVKIGFARRLGESAFDLVKTSIKSIITSIPDASEAAADFEKTVERVGFVFGPMGKLIIDTTNKISKSFGYAKGELNTMASQMGTMFVGMGMGKRMAGGLAAEFLKLGANAAVIQGIPLPEFMEGLEAGMRGSNRALKRFGIILTENQIEMAKTGLGLRRMRMWTDEQKDAYARLMLIMRALRNQGGDATGAMGGLKNQLRLISMRMEEMWITFGQAVKPLWTSIVTVFNRILESIAKLLERYKPTVETWAKEIGKKIEGLGFYWDNAGLYIAKFAVYIKDAFAKAGVIITNFRSIIRSIGAWMTNTFLEISVTIGDYIGTAFTNMKDNVLAFGKWLIGELPKLFKQASDAAFVSMFITQPAQEAFDKMFLRKKTPFAMNWGQVVGDAFKGLKPGPMPEMKGLGEGARGFQGLPALQFSPKVLAAFLKVAGATEEQVKAIQKQIDANKAQFDKEHKDKNKKGKPLAEMGVPFMGFPGQGKGGGDEGKKIAGGFVGIEEFAKKIQEGALAGDDVDKAALDTAMNTKKIMEMMLGLGPIMNNVFMGAGAAIR